MFTVKQETITPALAEAMLKRNTANRSIRRNLVQRYANDLTAGRWQFNGDSLSFAADGTLLDGQHRLMAVVKAGVPMHTLVVRGLSKEVFLTKDTGMRRTTAQTFGLHGIKNSAATAAMARWIRGLERGEGRSPQHCSSIELLEVVEQHPLIHHYASTGDRFRLISTSGCCAVLVLAAEKHGVESIDNFMNRVATGESLKKGDPEYQLRDRFLSNRARVARLSDAVQVAITIKAVRAYIEGRTVGVLRWTPTEEFPTL